MNGIDWKLVCYSTYFNQYIASVYYPYITFVSFSFLYILHKHLLLVFFSEAYCRDLVTQAPFWDHNGYQDVAGEAAVTMVCGHVFHSGWFEDVLRDIFVLFTPESAKIWHALRYHDGIEIDTSNSVIVVSPTSWETHHSPRASPSDCGELPKSLLTPQSPYFWYQFV